MKKIKVKLILLNSFLKLIYPLTGDKSGIKSFMDFKINILFLVTYCSCKIF